MYATKEEAKGNASKDDGTKQKLAVTGLTPTQQLVYDVIKVMLSIDAIHKTTIKVFLILMHSTNVDSGIDQQKVFECTEGKVSQSSVK